jgi:hypothetical protein
VTGILIRSAMSVILSPPLIASTIARRRLTAADALNSEIDLFFTEGPMDEFQRSRLVWAEPQSLAAQPEVLGR